MTRSDTVELLRECDAGAKMAVASMDEVLDKTHDAQLKALLSKSRQKHEELGNEIHALLKEHASDDKEPNPVARGMSWLKTNWKIGMDGSDATIADLMTDGCNMGVKSLNQYLNQYQAADQASKNLCGRLIAAEERLEDGLRQYL